MPDFPPVLPTATHADDDTHSTPFSWASVVPPGTGDRWDRHAWPVQTSMSGRPPADLAPKYGAGTS